MHFLIIRVDKIMMYPKIAFGALTVIAFIGLLVNTVTYSFGTTHVEPTRRLMENMPSSDPNSGKDVACNIYVKMNSVYGVYDVGDWGLGRDDVQGR